MGGLVWKVLGPGSAALAAMLAGRAVEALWKTAGRDVPQEPKNPAASGWGEAVVYAAVSGLAIGAAKVAAERKAAAYYIQSAGHPPKALRPAADR